MKTLFLINPKAGKSHNLSQVTGLIHAIYAGVGHRCEVRLIDFQRLDQDLREAEAEGVARVFAVGGDGTINAIGSRLVGCSMAFGVIPGGSGNGYGRHLGLPRRMVQALRLAPGLQAVKVDTGRFGGHTFLNLAGLGLDAEVAHQFSQSEQRGLVPYIGYSTRSLLQRKAIDLEIRLGQEWQRFPRVLGITIANGTQWGFAAKIAAGSSLTDGLLDVRIIHQFPLLMTPPLLLRLFQGSLQHSPFVTAFRTDNLYLRSQGARLMQLDGEPQPFVSEAEVRVQAASLNLLVPPDLSV